MKNTVSVKLISELMNRIQTSFKYIGRTIKAVALYYLDRVFNKSFSFVFIKNETKKKEFCLNSSI